MSATGRRLLIALLLVAGAGALRFHKLGTWPFDVDELPTMMEVRSLAGLDSAAPDTQTYRTPRMIPVGYWVIQLSTSLFGEHEFGSRVLLAAIGSLMVGVVFLFLEPLLGRRTAVASSLLLALWPEHIFHSQNTRFYIVAAFFSGVMMLAGAHAAGSRRWGWSLLACASGTLAVMSHTVTLLLFPVVGTGILAARLLSGARQVRDVVVPFAVAAVTLAALFVFYLRPLLAGWNSGEEWGYSPPRAVLASINMLGWPVFLLACTGTLLMLFSERRDKAYWLLCVAGWGAASVVVPLVTVYHPAYVFSFATGGLIMAGYAIATISERLRSASAVAAVLWIPLACLSNLPTLISHYADGTRTDTRAAARFVRANWRDGDRVAAFSIGTLHYYARETEPSFPLSRSDRAVATLTALTQAPGRLWIVVDKGRSGLPPGLQRWLFDHTSLRLEVEGKRLDYLQNIVEVFLFAPTSMAAPDRSELRDELPLKGSSSERATANRGGGM